MRILLFLLVCLTPTLAFSKVYKHVDENGNVYYSDVPDKKNAKPMKVEPITTYKNRTRTYRSRSSNDEGAPSASQRKNKTPAKFSVEVTSPTNDQAIRANDGNITLQASVNPQMRPNHSVAFYVDGKEVSKGKSTQASLKNVPRGTHSVQVKILDKDKVISSSETVSFHVLRAIAH